MQHGRTFLLRLTLLLCSCAPLQPHFATPKISINSLRLLPSSSLAPRFEIGLHIVNPNPIALAPKGIAYRVWLEGHEILSGAGNNLSAIAAYGEGDISIQASTDMLGNLLLISEMLARPRQVVTYRLEVRLDPGRFLPPILIRDNGHIPLQQSR